MVRNGEKSDIIFVFLRTIRISTNEIAQLLTVIYNQHHYEIH